MDILRKSCLTSEETILTEYYSEAELFGDPEKVACSRATALQQAPSRGRVTMGAAVLEDAQGNRRVVIGTSEPNGYLRSGARSALQAGEIVIPGYGHAEADIVTWAAPNNYKVIAVAAGRPICENCVQSIEGAGGIVASPKKSNRS